MTEPAPFKIKGVGKAEFQEWRHHPASKVFLQFLKDKQDFLKAAALDQWVNGADSFATCNQTIRGQIIELSEIADLPFEAMEEFYKERDNAAEDSQDGTRGIPPSNI